MKLYVDSMSTLVESYRSDEEYGDWYRKYESSVISVRVSDSAYTTEFEVSFDVIPGDIVHVLSLQYSEGDSFGNSIGNLEILWIFKDIEVAKTAKIIVENTDTYGVDIRDEVGNTIIVYNPGIGYFESVDSVDINTFVVQL